MLCLVVFICSEVRIPSTVEAVSLSSELDRAVGQSDYDTLCLRYVAVPAKSRQASRSKLGSVVFGKFLFTRG